MKTGSDQVSSKKTATIFFSLIWAFVWTPSFIATGPFSSHLAAQEESLDAAGDASEGETLQKKRPGKPLLKKVLEKKAPEDSDDESGLSADDLFGIGELEGEEADSLVDDVDAVEEVEVPTVLELIEAKDPGDLDLWERFLLHLKEEGHEEIIDEMGLNDVDNPVDFTQGDPIRGILFRVSGDLLRLDTLFQQAAGTPLEGTRRERALAAAESLRASDDPFLKVYGDYYQARLELEAAIDWPAEPEDDERESAEPDDDVQAEAVEIEEPDDDVQAEAFEIEEGLDPGESAAPEKVEMVRPRVKDEAALDRAKELFLGLTESKDFLPQDEARRYLADIYLALDDPTLAILEWQLYLTELPRARQAERTLAEERIREIRESTQHPGPLRESAGRMRLVSGRLDKGDVTEPTQTEEVRLEDVLEKIAKLLEKAEQAGGQSMSMQGQASQRSQLTRGQRGRKRQSQQLQQLARNGQQKGQQGQNQNQPNNRQNRDKQQHAGSKKGETVLKDEGEKDRDKWGKTNMRAVSTSLKGVWDKIPVTYRQLVSQYFQDISGLEPEKE